MYIFSKDLFIEDCIKLGYSEKEIETNKKWINACDNKEAIPYGKDEIGGILLKCDGYTINADWCKEVGSLKKYEFEIIKTLCRNVVVDAYNKEEAEEKLWDMRRNGEIELDGSDCDETQIHFLRREMNMNFRCGDCIHYDHEIDCCTMVGTKVNITSDINKYCNNKFKFDKEE